MSGSATPLFVDTGAFYARADADDANHDTAVRVFEGVRAGELAYRPLYTTQAVLSETATLCLRKLGHATATRVVDSVRQSETFNVLPVTRRAFADAADRFADYDDQTISFVDHTTAALADDRNVSHVFAFDDDFRTLGFTVVPGDVAAL